MPFNDDLNISGLGHRRKISGFNDDLRLVSGRPFPGIDSVGGISSVPRVLSDGGSSSRPSLIQPLPRASSVRNVLSEDPEHAFYTASRAALAKAATDGSIPIEAVPVLAESIGRQRDEQTGSSNLNNPDTQDYIEFGPEGPLLTGSDIKAYIDYARTDTKPPQASILTPEGQRDYGRVISESIAKFPVGVVEGAIDTISGVHGHLKKALDSIVGIPAGVNEHVKGAVDNAVSGNLLKVLEEAGQTAAEPADGLRKALEEAGLAVTEPVMAMAEPLGVSGLKKAEERWLTDPVGSAAAVASLGILKGGRPRGVKKAGPVSKVQARAEESTTPRKPDAPVAQRDYKGNLETKASDAVSDRRKMILERAISEGKHVPPEALKDFPELSIRAGQNAVQKMIAEKNDVPKAMYRDDLGAVSFYWGKEGNPAKGYNDGSGISHIIAKCNSEGFNGKEIAMMMPEVIVKGRLGEIYGPRGGQRVNIKYGDHEAVLSLYRLGYEEIWLLTGWKEKTPGAPVVSTNQQGYTRQTFGSRSDAGAGVDTSLTKIKPEVNKNSK